MANRFDKIFNLCLVAQFFGVVLALSALNLAPVLAMMSIRKEYVITTLNNPPAELSEFGMVLHVDEEVARKILESSVRLYLDLNISKVAVLAEVKWLNLVNADVEFRVRTVCLGVATSTCYVKMHQKAPTVVFGITEVGYVDGTSMVIPELSNIVFRANDFDAESVSSIVRGILYAGLVVIISALVATAIIARLDKRKESYR